MEKFLKIIPSRKTKRLDSDTGVELTEGQSTSNPILTASAPSHCPIGCEILFEGTTPIVAE
jgi:hypothetical protein